MSYTDAKTRELKSLKKKICCLKSPKITSLGTSDKSVAVDGSTYTFTVKAEEGYAVLATITNGAFDDGSDGYISSTIVPVKNGTMYDVSPLDGGAWPLGVDTEVTVSADGYSETFIVTGGIPR